MQIIRIILGLSLFVAPSLASDKVWDAGHQIKFILDDPLDHPFYWWPRTLLSYRIQFTEAVRLETLRLESGDGHDVAAQWSDVTTEGAQIKTATLNFFSDLPVGGHRDFVLSTSRSTAATTRNLVTESIDGKAVLLDSGALRVRLPATQDVSGEAPGPILQLSREQGNWYGSSAFTLDHDRVTHIQTERVESGPLFITYELVYTTEHKQRYVARVRCVAGLEFVQLRENMEGLADSTRGTWTFKWEGLPVSFRQSSNHPYPFPNRIADYDQYHWEAIDQRQTNTHLGVQPGIRPDGQLPFNVGVYEPWWAFSTSTFANFWDREGADAVGVFINRVKDWQDHDYAIWHASPKLQVHFFYRDKTLSFSYPVSRGSRTTCFTVYDHRKDVESMHRLEAAVKGETWHDGFRYTAGLSPTSYTLFLQNRYGTLDLNEMKDWVLTQPLNAKAPKIIFSQGMVKSADELERRVMSSRFVNELPITGTRQNGGFGPVASREIQEWWIDGFNRFETQLSERQRRRLSAMYLFMAYVHADEDYMPMIPMLSGHPNFLSDVKSVPASMTFLFPWHPKANTWADEFEKFTELNTRYHTRPPVPSWDAQGGRWTENLGTYVWAFLRPSLRASFLLQQFDGQNRFVTDQLAELGNWLVDSLSAPFEGESAEFANDPRVQKDMHEWGIVTPQTGPRRVYPPMGAHAERRIPPRSLWYLGLTLLNYAPLTAEHAMWAARPTDQDMETPRNRPDPWSVMFSGPDNRGTDPHLRSTKYTGFGITLRAAVGTPKELSVHLQQIDDGPNYRWGNAAEGGNGVLYFYAAGKSYSYNGQEDVGDRTAQDTDFCTNFGVWKDGYFHAIGRNVLSQPLYDLGVGQFAELIPRTGPGSYSAPEYVSRSVLLAGSDYFVLYDDVFNESVSHRLSWYVRNGEAFPTIRLLKGASRGIATQRTEIKTSQTTGEWFDGIGDSMAVVSNRTDLETEATPYGARVHAPGVDDFVFRDPDGIDYSKAGIEFHGSAGLIRQHGNGSYELALFQGSNIGIPGLLLTTEARDLAISAVVDGRGSRAGDYMASRNGSIHFRIEHTLANSAFYIDGQKQLTIPSSGEFDAKVPSGSHHWEISPNAPVPMPPIILRTENFNGGANVVLSPVASATGYRLELSTDGGATWKESIQSSGSTLTISHLPNDRKVHVRALSVNQDHESKPGPEYPIYLSSRPPAAPDGLRVQLSEGEAILTWGEVLGASDYKLYARVGNRSDFQLLYHGLQRTYTDKREFIQPSAAVPASGTANRTQIVEYRVTASNGNGEGVASRVANTDPASWRNWEPMFGEKFRRTSVRSAERGVSVDVNSDYYPR